MSASAASDDLCVKTTSHLTLYRFLQVTFYSMNIVGLLLQLSQFLPPERSALGRYCCGDVAVCVSVTLMYCAKTTESIIMRPSPDSSRAILVFPSHEPGNWRAEGIPFIESVKSEWGRYMSKNRPLNRLYDVHMRSGGMSAAAELFVDNTLNI